MNGYRRKPHHEKKEPQDKAWWIHSGIVKDRRRSKYSMTPFCGSIHLWFKTFARRVQRRVVKNKMHSADWDNWVNKPADAYVDPWGWD